MVKLLNWLKHSLGRFASVAIITAIITGGICLIFLFKKPAIKPDQRGNTGTINNMYSQDHPNEVGLDPLIFRYGDKTGYGLILRYSRKF